MLDREHPAGASEAGLHLVDDHDDPVAAAQLPHADEEVLRGDDEACLALHGLDDDRGDRLCFDLGDERALERGQRVRGGDAAILVREGHAVDLGRERPQAGLVGVGLRRQRQREQRAAVEASLEGDHGGALRICARELDRVLHRFGAGVEEGRLRGRVEGRQLEQPLRKGDVALVGHDGEVRVAEARQLLLCGRDHARVRVPDVQAADPAGEVDERVAVDVRERRAPALGRDDRQVERQRVGDQPLLPLDDLAGARPGNLGLEVDRAGGCHVATISHGLDGPAGNLPLPQPP